MSHINVEASTTTAQIINPADAKLPSIFVHPSKGHVEVYNTDNNCVVSEKSTPIAKLNAMEQSRLSWETTELAASNKRKYAILQSAYSYYDVMKNDSNKDVRKEHSDTLELFIKQRGYVFMPSTHDMTRVVKCVFGMDRRRVSAYSIALREALRQEITPDDLVTFIEENGGVEQIRLGGTKPLSANTRAEKVKGEVTKAELGLFKLDPKLYGANAEWNDKQVVIVATYLPTGEFQANAVLKHDSAVNAALAGYYSQKEAKKRAEEKALRDQQKQEAQAAQEEAQKQKGIEKSEKQETKRQTQLKKAEEEHAAEQLNEALQSQWEMLSEGAPA